MEALSGTTSVQCVRCSNTWQPLAIKDDLIAQPEVESEPVETLADADAQDVDISVPDSQSEPIAEEQSEPVNGVDESQRMIGPFQALSLDLDEEEKPEPNTPIDFTSRRASQTLSDDLFEKPGSAKAPKRSRFGTIFKNMAAALVAVFVFGGGLIYKQDIVKAMPDMAGLYELAGIETNTRGLRFVNIETSSTRDGAIEKLIVDGAVENITTGSIKVPTIRIALRDKSQSEIFTWTAEPEQDELKPGEATRFISSIDTPPQEAADVRIHFLDEESTSNK